MENNDKKLRSEQYKAKLNEMMKQMIEDDQKEEDIILEEIEETFEEETVTPTQSPLRIGKLDNAIIIPSIEIHLPVILEKYMTYSWCPFNDLFHPPTEPREGETLVLDSKGDS